jgi:multiple sugar transport system ATP-binding protein
MANVSLRKLNIVLGGKPIIRDLDLAVEPGEFLVLLGPSGCGKSTLLHSIAGLVDSDSGAIEIGGRDMTDADPSERGIGMVFQSYALYPTMTVAIGRALVREAKVFLFDEPLSNLDAKLRAELRRELKLLHQTLGSTMIYVTHDQVEAMTLASRIVVMEKGAIQQIGTPLDVYDRPANRFVAGFLGAPAMAFVDGELGADGRFRADGIELAPAHEACPAAQAAVLGVRPEHVDIRADGSLQGEVTLVEPMGNHHVVWLRCGKSLLASLVHDARRCAPGDKVAFAIDAARVSLFDPQTGNRL